MKPRKKKKRPYSQVRVALRSLIAIIKVEELQFFLDSIVR
jgi:hypothetical protein